MVNVGKYTIHGWYGYIHVYSVGAKSTCISSYQSPIPFASLASFPTVSPLNRFHITHTVDGSEILNHLGCIKPCK